jgi:hypothetical protein
MPICINFFHCGQHKKIAMSEAHSTNTRCKHDLYMPGANFTGYQKGVYCAGTKLHHVFYRTLKS